mmetsp:Transcript_123503/g.354838  ORF Transcript_123503/g.354838 Transcript_123503/m.354838 type:complete len:209 (+) Transcript_123503:771-1397(+)
MIPTTRARRTQSQLRRLLRKRWSSREATIRMKRTRRPARANRARSLRRLHHRSGCQNHRRAAIPLIPVQTRSQQSKAPTKLCRLLRRRFKHKIATQRVPMSRRQQAGPPSPPGAQEQRVGRRRRGHRPPKPRRRPLPESWKRWRRRPPPKLPPRPRRLPLPPQRSQRPRPGLSQPPSPRPLSEPSWPQLPLRQRREQRRRQKPSATGS